MARAAVGRLVRLVAILAIATGALGRPVVAQDDPAAPRIAAPLTILQLNDVYSTVPVDDRGGLARVATLKQQLTKSGRTPLMLLAGDFLSSSVASTVFKGEQMIAALNARFRSRQQHTFAEKLLSAMRFGFGGHVEKNQTIMPLGSSNIKRQHQ